MQRTLQIAALLRCNVRVKVGVSHPVFARCVNTMEMAPVEDRNGTMNNTPKITAKGFATGGGEGERIWFVADTLTLKATAASTGRSFTVV